MSIHLLNNHEQEVLEFFEGEVKIPTNLSMISPSISNCKINDFPNYVNCTWFNGRKIYKHVQTEMITFTSTIAFEGHFKAKILITECLRPGYVVVGFINRYFNGNKGYLGGNLVKGSWGLAGNEALGEHRVLAEYNKKFNEGDIVELSYNKGLITYSINNESNTYKFKFGDNKPVYLAASCYGHTTFVILDF